MTVNLQYLLLLGMLVGTGTLAGVLNLLKTTLGPTLAEPGKAVPAEAGQLAPEPAWVRYHVHHHGFALLFLCFDMEMAFMYPWAVVYKELGMTALLDMGVFLLILFLGLL